MVEEKKKLFNDVENIFLDIIDLLIILFLIKTSRNMVFMTFLAHWRKKKSKIKKDDKNKKKYV